MILSKVVNRIAKRRPKFNDEVLLGIRKREINGIMDFLTQFYKDFLKVVDLPITMKEPYVVSPIDRLKYELEHTGYGSTKTQFKVHMDEASLVCWEFEYDGKAFAKYLYLPYIYEDNYVMINGARYDFMLHLSEKLFCVRGDGVTIKVIRIPLWFKLDGIRIVKSESSGNEYSSTIVISRIHDQTITKNKKAVKPNIILYLLAKFGLVGCLKFLGLKGDEIQYCNKMDDPENYEYVRIQNLAMKNKPVMVKFHKKHAKEKHVIDVVVAINYSLGKFRNIFIENLLEDDIVEYRVFLGKSIYGKDTPRDKAYRNMDLHIQSTDNYLDTYYKKIFAANGIYVDNIYELLLFVLDNITDIVQQYKPNNMFHKRFDCLYSVVIDGYIKKLYDTLYKKDKRNNQAYMYKYVAAVLGVTLTAEFILKKARTMSSVKVNAAICNDNWLLSIGCKSVKNLGNMSKHTNALQADSNRYHPSMLIVESAVGFSSSNPSKNFFVNPFVKVDASGGVVKTRFASKVNREMIRYLSG